MQGYRTIIFNALMLIVGLAGAEVAPETAEQVADAFVLTWGVVNVILRAVTKTPIFKKET